MQGLRRAVGSRLRNAFTVERDLPDGSIAEVRGTKRVLNDFNRRLIEQGRRPPWVATQAQVEAYWQGREPGAEANDPVDIAAKDNRIVDFLDSFWQPEVSHDDRVLELGPNAGPNLNRLQELGYTRLHGVDINPNALELMKRSFPALAEAATLSLGSFDDVLPTLESDSADVVFSMAVLMHVHPGSKTIFPEIVRIAAKYICVIELERASNTYVFPRDYRRMFERFGCREIRSFYVTPESAPNVSRDYDGYVARLLAVR